MDFLILLGLVLGIIIFINHIKKTEKSQYVVDDARKQERQLEEQEYEEILSVYDDKKKQINIPEDAKLLYLKDTKMDTLTYDNMYYYCWKSEVNLKFFPYWDRTFYFYKPFRIIEFIKVVEIEYDNINYFKEVGEVYRENKITGGGGGGSSIKGAVVGGVLAGDTGAIIGSRKKNNEIKSELISHDTREVQLVLKDRRILLFDKDTVDDFIELIPKKEYSYSKNKKYEELHNNSTQISVENRIVSLNSLKEKGLISDEEYEDKKAEILSSL